MSTDPDNGLHTLCYRIDPAVLGGLVRYPLTAEFLTAWDAFSKRTRAAVDRDLFSPRFSAVATALTAATSQPVRLFARGDLSDSERQQGIAALLVTTATIDPWLMATALRTFERLSCGDPAADTLAELIAGIEPEMCPVAQFVVTDPGTGACRAPGWVYEAARWNLAARIVAAPMLIDGRLSVPLRLDTEGDILAWDRPLVRASRNSTGHATVRISTKIITVPGACGLYLRLDGHVSRHPYSWSFVKNAWLDQGDPALPIVKLPVLSPYPAKGRRLPEFRGFTAEVVESCGLHPIALPAELPSAPGSVRPVGRPLRHSIGRGPGVRFLHQFGLHATEQLGIPPLRYARTTVSASGRITGPIPASKLDTAISASRAGNLRIACVYASDAARRRMTDALTSYATTVAGPLAGVPDGTVVSMTERLAAVMHQAGDLLRHGDHDRGIGSLTWLDTPDGTGLAVLAETDWDPGKPPEDDAKPAVRRLLASHGIVTQFLNANWEAPKPRKRTVRGVTSLIQPSDEPAAAAVRDLLRATGVNDNRLAAATVGPRQLGPLDREAILIGLHIRQHTPRRRKAAKLPNRLVIRLVAFHATPDPVLPWYTATYDDRRGEWVPYRIGTASYHAAAIGVPDLTRERKHQQAIRDLVDEALAAGGFSRFTPLVIFTDAQACQGIWPGLNNATFGRGPLPGSAIGHPDLAVVRCANGDRVPQPTHRGHGSRARHDPGQPPLPRAALYEHDECGTASWLLAQTSRTYRSGQVGARAGASYTRWTLPGDKASLMGKDWHGLTAIEIAVASPGGWQPRQLAALTARLCEQAASWDDRTQSPAPLHLAERQDLDHPERAEQPEDGDAD